MYPTQHIILGILFSLVCFLLFPQIELIGFSIILFSSVLIDVDHYLYYVHKKKDFSLKNAYKWFIKNTNKFLSLSFEKRNKVYVGFCFLHGIEILAIILFLTIFSKYFFFIFIGFSFHLFLDITHGTINLNRIDRFSMIYDYLKFKKMESIENA